MGKNLPRRTTDASVSLRRKSCAVKKLRRGVGNGTKEKSGTEEKLK